MNIKQSFICIGHYIPVDRDRLKQEKLIQRTEGRKEMFYLTTHSTHFSYGYFEHFRAGVSLNIHSFIHSFIQTFQRTVSVNNM